MADTKLEVEVEVTGAVKAAQDLTAVASAEKAAAQAAELAARGLKLVEDAEKRVAAATRQMTDEERRAAQMKREMAAQMKANAAVAKESAASAMSVGDAYKAASGKLAVAQSAIGKFTFTLQTAASFIGAGVLGPLGALTTAAVAVGQAMGLVGSKSDEALDRIRAAGKAAREAAPDLRKVLESMGQDPSKLSAADLAALGSQAGRFANLKDEDAQLLERRLELMKRIDSNQAKIDKLRADRTRDADLEEIAQADIKELQKSKLAAQNALTVAEIRHRAVAEEIGAIQHVRDEQIAAYRETQEAQDRAVDASIKAYDDEQRAKKAAADKAERDAKAAADRIHQHNLEIIKREREARQAQVMPRVNAAFGLAFDEADRDVEGRRQTARVLGLDTDTALSGRVGGSVRAIRFINPGRQFGDGATPKRTEIQQTLDQMAKDVPSIEGVLVGSFNNIAMSFGQMTSQMIIAGNLSGGAMKKWAGEVLSSISAQAIGYGTLAELLALVAGPLGLAVTGGTLAAGGAALIAFGIATGVTARALGAGATPGSSRASGGGSTGGENRGRNASGAGAQQTTNVYVNSYISRRRLTDEVEAETSSRGQRGQRAGSRLAFAS